MLARLSFPPKLISVLCVIQVAAIITGVLISGVFLKMEGMVWEMTYASSLMQFVRYHGIWFLVVPAAWAAWAMLHRRDDDRMVEVEPLESWLGVALTTVLVLFFAWTALRAICLATMQHGPMQMIEKTSN